LKIKIILIANRQLSTVNYQLSTESLQRANV